ncbi:hypothetical protein V8E54_003375 [Elaphomyces granulatus]
MPPRHGSRQIATLPVERSQYTPSSEPDDEEDSTPDPRQASGNCHGSEQSPEVTREPSGSRTLSEVDKEFGTVSKLLLKLCRQGYDDESFRQQSECITRLEELRLEFKSIFFNPKPPPQADLASPPLPVKDPENSGINSNEHCCDRSAQGSVSTPPSDNAPITSIQGEDPKDPRDKMIPNTRQGRVSLAANPSSMPIAANVTAITKAIIPIGVSPNTTTQDSNVNLGPDNFWYRPPKNFEIYSNNHSRAQRGVYAPPSGNIRSIMTKGYAFMHAGRPHVLALQGIG